MTETTRPILVIGGAGFIGSNVAAHLAARGNQVRVYDDLSRPGVELNVAWLRQSYGDNIDVRVADIRDRDSLRAAVADARAVFHFAAQTAVTTSLVDPVDDFTVNAAGTVEVLEALRALPEPPPLVFTSTNKVYGCLPDVPLQRVDSRWMPVDPALANGIDERRPLEFRTPYGCSKGTADQYVLDYAQTYGLRTCVFRMSCIYGPRQFGTEDQGWVAHFLIRALQDQTITIYGDGYQVRDVLFVDDLVDALVRAWTQIDDVKGRAFNIGGGAEHTLSLMELVDMIERLRGGRRPRVQFGDWRPGDQRYYVSDTTAFRTATGWAPRVSPRAGVEALHGWLVANQDRVMPASSASAVVEGVPAHA